MMGPATTRTRLRANFADSEMIEECRVGCKRYEAEGVMCESWCTWRGDRGREMSDKWNVPTRESHELGKPAMTAITPEGLRGARADFLEACTKRQHEACPHGNAESVARCIACVVAEGEERTRAHAAALDELAAYKDAAEKRTEERDHAMLREDTLYFEVLEYVESGKAPEKAARALAIVDAIKRAELARLKAPVDVAGIVKALGERQPWDGHGVWCLVDLGAVKQAAAALESLAAQVADFKEKWFQSNRNLHAAWNRAERAEQQLAEREAELAKIKGHADRLRHELAWLLDFIHGYQGHKFLAGNSAVAEYDAAYPKEDDK